MYFEIENNLFEIYFTSNKEEGRKLCRLLTQQSEIERFQLASYNNKFRG
jgi:hypothetical protein